jgi:hypothetical protein
VQSKDKEEEKGEVKVQKEKKASATTAKENGKRVRING